MLTRPAGLYAAAALALGELIGLGLGWLLRRSQQGRAIFYLFGEPEDER